MWQDSPFAEPVPSFTSPVVAPNVDPDASPTISVTLACEWLPFVRGALQQLLLQSTWNPAGPDLTLTQERVFNLIDLFQECSGGIPFACPYDFSLGDVGWSVELDTNFTPALQGFYVAGQGFACGCEVQSGTGITQGMVQIIMDFSPVITLTELDVRYDLTNGVFSPGGDPFIDLTVFAGGSQTGRHYQFNPPQGSFQSFALTTSPISVDHIQIRLKNASFNPGAGNCGSGMIRNVVVRGTGSPPC